jgi:hypothetical protein
MYTQAFDSEARHQVKNLVGSKIHSIQRVLYTHVEASEPIGDDLQLIDDRSRIFLFFVGTGGFHLGFSDEPWRNPFAENTTIEKSEKVLGKYYLCNVSEDSPYTEFAGRRVTEIKLVRSKEADVISGVCICFGSAWLCFLNDYDESTVFKTPGELPETLRELFDVQDLE